MKEKILQSIEEGVAVIRSLETHVEVLAACAEMLADCFSRGGKILIAGNGGSLCDAMHFAEELTGFFRKKRRALPALALADPGHMSCVGNDAGFEYIFSRGIEAHGKPEDIVILLTTSGNSDNLVRAMDQAENMGLSTIAFLGKGGGKLKGRADYEILIDHFTTSDRVQEAHMTAIHILIEQVENLLFSSNISGVKDVACVG